MDDKDAGTSLAQLLDAVPSEENAFHLLLITSMGEVTLGLDQVVARWGWSVEEIALSGLAYAEQNDISLLSREESLRAWRDLEAAVTGNLHAV